MNQLLSIPSRGFRPAILLVTLLLAIGLSTDAAENDHIINADVVVAVLKGRQAPVYENALAGFKEVFSANNVQASYQEMTVTEEIKHSPATMILALGSGALKEAAQYTSEIPIIFSAVMAPRDSLPAQPNITGSLLNVSSAKQLKELSAALPDARRIGVIYVPRENDELVKAGRVAAEDLSLELLTFEVEHARDIPQVSTMDIDVLWLVPNTVTGQLPILQHLLSSCFRYRIPVMGLSPSYVKAGALMAVSPDPRDVGSQAGELALEVLKGTPPDQLEPTEPRQLKVSINLTVADKLRLKISQETVNKATQIFGK